MTTPPELFDEKDDDLWEWARIWATAGAVMGDLPPLPIGDEVDQFLRGEGLG
jgi:hypothetical protein